MIRDVIPSIRRELGGRISYYDNDVLAILQQKHKSSKEVSTRANNSQKQAEYTARTNKNSRRTEVSKFLNSGRYNYDDNIGIYVSVEAEPPEAGRGRHLG